MSKIIVDTDKRKKKKGKKREVDYVKMLESPLGSEGLNLKAGVSFPEGGNDVTRALQDIPTPLKDLREKTTLTEVENTLPFKNRPYVSGHHINDAADIRSKNLDEVEQSLLLRHLQDSGIDASVHGRGTPEEHIHAEGQKRSLQMRGLAATTTKEAKPIVKNLIEKSDLSTAEKKQVEIDAKDPVKMQRAIARSDAAKQQGQQPSPRDAFMEALSFFLPTALGALVGGAIEGTEGAVAGAETATSLGASFRDHQLKKEEMSLKRESMKPVAKQVNLQQSEFTDKEGNPLMFDPSAGKYIKPDGTTATDFVDPKTTRQEAALERADRRIELADLKHKHGIKKDQELSDSQVKSLSDMDNTLSSIDRIEELKKEVATGLGVGQGQSFAAVFGAAPEKFVELRSETSSALSSYMKQISGAQVSEPEAQRLSVLIPSVNDAPSVFNAKVKAFRRIVNGNKTSMINAIRKGQPLKKLTGLEGALKDVEMSKKSSKGEKVPVKVPKSTADIDKMTKEELKAFLGE